MKLGNLILVVCTITILLFSLQIHTPLAGASVTNSDFLKHIQEQEKIHGMIEFFSYPRLTNINGWARDTHFMQYFNRNTKHVIYLYLNDNLFAEKVEFRQYGSSIDTIPDSVANGALKKLGYNPVPSVSMSPSPTVSTSPSPTVSPSPSPRVSPSPSPTVSTSLSLGSDLEAIETLRIPPNGTVTFNKSGVGKVIPEIRFYRPTFGNVTVAIPEIETSLGYKMIEITVPEPMKASPAIIFFQVEKEWLYSRHFDKEEVELYRGASDWVGLKARWITTKGAYEQYSAATPGFSIFKITAKKEKLDWGFYAPSVVIGIAIYIIFEIRQRQKKGSKDNKKK